MSCWSGPMSINTDGKESFSVLHWGSHPEKDNDDCWQGWDFDTLEEAEAKFAETPTDTSTAFIELDGPGINKVRKNPSFNPRQQALDDAEWRSEFAHQQGMGLGVDAYNEAMGWDEGVNHG